MQLEIELKAWVDDPARLESELPRHAQFLRTYDKDDRYYRFGKGKPDVRLRTEDDGTFLTWKEKEIRDGIETSREHETLVDNPSALEDLLPRLGASLWMRKRKTGTAWQMDRILVEFSLVHGLGHFVELEILAPGDTDPEECEALGRLLRASLGDLGISGDRIESRAYTAMLREATKAD